MSAQVCAFPGVYPGTQKIGSGVVSAKSRSIDAAASAPSAVTPRLIAAYREALACRRRCCFLGCRGVASTLNAEGITGGVQGVVPIRVGNEVGVVI